MSQTPPVADEPEARPYGLLGLLVSLVVIVAIAAGLAVIAGGLVFAVATAARGWDGALDMVTRLVLDPAAGAREASAHLAVTLGLSAYAVQILAVLAVARFRGGRGWAALVAWRDWRLRSHWKLLAGLMALVLLWSVGASIGLERFYPPAKDWISAPRETPWILGFLVLTVLAGPIAEELLFRGWIYTALRARFGLRTAVLATSIVFALAHWESTHLYALAVFPVGLALAIVRERTGTIAASITFHAAYNGVASVLLFLGK